MTNRHILRGDFFSALIAIALSSYILVVASGYGLWDFVGPGPGFFPIVYGVLMLLMGIALLIKSLYGKVRVETLEPQERDGTYAAIAAWVGLALSIPVMMVGGFVGGFGLLTFFMIRVLFGKSTLTSLIATVSITLGLYLVFHVALELELPPSMFEGR
jgi:putative tricarboxylic transport membrane protein